MNNITADTNLMEFLPDWYKDIAEYQEIMRVESGRMVTALSEMQTVHGNLFFGTMDAGAVSAWENILGLIASGDLDFRRQRVLNRIATNPPFSIKALKEKLDAIIGDYVLTVDGPNYTIYVEASAENQAYAIELAYTVNSMKPAHIVYVLTPYTAAGMLMSEEIRGQENTYNYRLGSWGLGLSPFMSPGTEEVLKVATTPSIQNDYIYDTAEAAKDDIASIRLNSSIAISTFTATRVDGVITVSYSVTTADTSLITKVEMLNSNGDVLTESDIYVPIAQNTTMKHVITVSEGTNGN